MKNLRGLEFILITKNGTMNGLMYENINARPITKLIVQSKNNLREIVLILLMLIYWLFFVVSVFKLVTSLVNEIVFIVSINQ